MYNFLNNLSTVVSGVNVGASACAWITLFGPQWRGWNLDPSQWITMKPSESLKCTKSKSFSDHAAHYPGYNPNFKATHARDRSKTTYEFLI